MPALIVIAMTVILSAGLFSLRGRALPSAIETSLSPTPASTEAPSPTIYSPSPTSLPPSTPKSATPTPYPTGAPKSSVTGWDYPGSRKISDGVYESSDDTDTITDWYRVKINALGYNVKTFVKTKANDKVLNKLVGARQGEELSVEISKNPGSSAARIAIHIDN